MHTEWLLWNIDPTLLYCANRQSAAKSGKVPQSLSPIPINSATCRGK